MVAIAVSVKVVVAGVIVVDVVEVDIAVDVILLSLAVIMPEVALKYFFKYAILA